MISEIRNLVTVATKAACGPPPIGICLLIASAIGKASLKAAALAMLPTLLISVTVLMLVTYIREISLFLPSLAFSRQPGLLTRSRRIGALNHSP